MGIFRFTVLRKQFCTKSTVIGQNALFYSLHKEVLRQTLLAEKVELKLIFACRSPTKQAEPPFGKCVKEASSVCFSLSIIV